MLTMPWAVPSVALGLNVRAKSKPTIEPGPPTEMTMTSSVSSHSGAAERQCQHDRPDRGVARDDGQHQP